MRQYSLSTREGRPIGFLLASYCSAAFGVFDSKSCWHLSDIVRPSLTDLRPHSRYIALRRAFAVSSVSLGCGSLHEIKNSKFQRPSSGQLVTCNVLERRVATRCLASNGGLVEAREVPEAICLVEPRNATTQQLNRASYRQGLFRHRF